MSKSSTEESTIDNSSHGLDFRILSIIGGLIIAYQIGLFLVAGIFLQMIADVWYYYLETFEAYYSSHVVNTMWVAAFMLVIYALIQHKRTI